VLDTNPAALVRGQPTPSAPKDSDPDRSRSQALIESIAVGMDLEDLCRQAGRSCCACMRKAARFTKCQWHHRLLEHLDAYMAALRSGIRQTALFAQRSAAPAIWGGERLSRHDAYAMVDGGRSDRGRLRKSAITPSAHWHYDFLENEGTLELAQEWPTMPLHGDQAV